MRRLFVLMLVLAGCGGVAEPPVSEIGFAVHELECPMMGCNGTPADTCLQARLEVTGIDGSCRSPDLIVTADRRVSGQCSGVTTGNIRDFRLVYFYRIGGTEIDLATVTARLDLREETEASVRLEFPQDRIVTNIDDDGDMRFNIVEFCQGTNPRVRD